MRGAAAGLSLSLSPWNGCRRRRLADGGDARCRRTVRTALADDDETTTTFRQATRGSGIGLRPPAGARGLVKQEGLSFSLAVSRCCANRRLTIVLQTTYATDHCNGERERHPSIKPVDSSSTTSSSSSSSGYQRRQKECESSGK